MILLGLLLGLAFSLLFFGWLHAVYSTIKHPESREDIAFSPVMPLLAAASIILYCLLGRWMGPSYAPRPELLGAIAGSGVTAYVLLRAVKH